MRLLGRVVLAVAVVVAFGAAKSAVSFYGLTFPDRIGNAAIGRTQNFESEHRGLGYGVSYQKPDWVIDIYVYDLGRSSIPEDVNSEVLKAQLKEAQGDIFELEKRGAYTNVKRTGSFLIKDHRGRARFTCDEFSYTRPDMGQVDSYLCLTGWRDKFIKYRLTTAQRAGSAVDAKRFMAAWLPVLWP